jgi:hypothetical protein
MSPFETWLFIGLLFALLLAAVAGGGRFIDWVLDTLWDCRTDLDDAHRRDKAMGIMESWTRGKG